MKAVRLLLVVLWALFGLTATAHAMPVSMDASPCGMPAAEMAVVDMPSTAPASKQAPHDDQGTMPCCSQPVIVAPAEIAVPVALRVEAVRLSPAPARVLTGLILPSEPRPPQTA